MEDVLDFSRCEIIEINEAIANRNVTNLVILDLSHNQIRNIEPLTFQHMLLMKVLILSYNLISSLNSCLAPLINLENLNLANNLIQRLPQNTFHQNKKLEILELQHNILKSLKPKLFMFTVNLKFLNLKKNNISKLKKSLFPLTKLKHLNLSYNQISYISNNFKNNGNLKKLYLSTNPIQILTRKCFNKLLNLRQLYLCDNIHVVYEDNVFARNLHLKKLMLTNTKTDFRQFEHLTQLQTLVLNCNDIDDQYFHSAFNHLTNLRYLNLNNNLITKLDHAILRSNRHLETLTLSSNWNMKDFTVEFFRCLPNLKSLNVSECNPLCDLNFNVFVYNTQLETLHVSYTTHVNGTLPISLKQFFYNGTIMAENLPQFIPLSVHNHLENLTIQYLDEATINSDYFSKLSSLTYLDLSYNNITSLQAMLFANLINLSVLKLNDNKLIGLESTLFGPHNVLKLLSMVRCNLDRLTCGFFENLTRLEFLLLTQNPFRTLDENVFQNLIQLKFLYLNNCNLSSLHVNIFRNNLQLMEVHLEFNYAMRRVPVECFMDLESLNEVSYSNDMAVDVDQLLLRYKLKVVR